MSQVYLNGAFVSDGEARISVSDGGWLHGAGLFETMRAEHGRIFRLDAHLDRLRRSAWQILRPIEPQALPDESIFAELLERNLIRSARVRMTVSAGSLQNPTNAEGQEPTVCITTAPLDSYPADLYEQGGQIVVCNFKLSTTDPIAGHKTTAYLPRLLGLRQARLAQCIEALWFTNENHLAEGCMSNVFILRGKVLQTPPIDTPVLPGIARSVVLEMAASANVTVQECPLTIDDLLDADEVLLTNAIMQVMPVIRVEEHDIGAGRVGPMAKRLLEQYRKLVQTECSQP